MKHAERHFRSSFTLNLILATCFFLISASTCSFAVEDLQVDVPYPLTPPAELFPGIDHWTYVRTSPPIFIPKAIIIGELDIERDYNLGFDASYTFRNFKHRFGAGRNYISAIKQQSTYHMFSSFHLAHDSLSLQYNESKWFSSVKSVYGIHTGFSKKGQGYHTVVSTRFNRSDSLNDYTVSTTYSRFYGYASMLSLEIGYTFSPYSPDKERTILLKLYDRFAYRDFLFFSPGIKSEFLSQSYFSPFLMISFLATKHISFSLFSEANALSDDVKKPYELPFLIRNDSLATPLDLFSATITSRAQFDSSFILGIDLQVKRTKDPLFLFDHERYFLCQMNLDTTIIVSSASFNLNFSRKYFVLRSSLSASRALLYDDPISYNPDYRFAAHIQLKPLKQIILTGSLDGTGKMRSFEAEEIRPHFILSSSLQLCPSPFFSIHIAGINIADYRGLLFNEVRYPGRIITSGISIQIQ